MARRSRVGAAELSVALVTVVAAALAFSALASAKALAPFGHACQAAHGVRFCPTADSAHRVPTFDGVPLDADVTLPAHGKGPFPTIVMMHGYGGSKTDFESTSPGGPDPNAAGGSNIYHYNNNFYARRGYAVLTYTARGFGDSCGGGPSGDHTGACGQGFIRLADTRFEARDTQYLLGLLADQRIVKPRDIGVTGISYGGGQSTELAFLRNKIRKHGGKLAPWRSPDGRRMAIRAAYPRWPWSDLVDALLPNGRFLDTKVAPFKQSLKPIGVAIQSYITGLFALGQTSGYYCGTAPASTPCPDRDADLPRDYAETQAGQPLSPDALSAINGIYRHDEAYALRFVAGHPRPSPLLIQNGWTDDLFPPSQALRVYNYLRSRYPHFPVSLQFGDLGHSRGSNKPRLNHYFNDQGARFFAAHLKRGRHGPAPGSVSAFIQTCPITKPDDGPFHASKWSAIHPRRFRFGSRTVKTFTSAGGDPSVAGAFDPIAGTSDSCKTIPVTSEPNVATYQRKVTKGFTMLGLPTVHATIATTGQFGQIDARLWDLSPGGTQRLISRGVYSLTSGQSGRIAFQLHGNGYRFAAGHKVQLELLGRDAPYYQAGNSPYSVDVSKLRISLPLKR